MPFAPTDLANLTLWLDAQALTGLSDGAAVATWPDTSGLGHDATQGTGGNQPVYRTSGINAHPAVEFSSSKFMATASFLDSGYDSALTVFVVAAKTDAALGVPLCLGGATWFLTKSTTISGVGVGAVPGTKFSAPGPWTIYGYRYNGSAQKFTVQGIWGRGNASFSGSGALGLAGVARIGNLGGSFQWVGKIGEVLVYKRALSDSEVTQVADYLTTKWSAAATTTTLLVCDGNSMTAGIGHGAASEAETYPQQAVAILGAGYAAANLGVSGQTTQQMVDDFATEPGLLSAVAPMTIYIPWEFVNHLYGGATATVARDAYITYCTTAMATGAKVVAVTMLPASSGTPPGDLETSRATINTYLRAHYPEFAHALADVAADARIGDAGDETNATYYAGDRIHLSAAGYAIVGGIVAAAVQSITAPARRTPRAALLGVGV